MATGKAFDGNPYAENPHMRFDEGEVASATSRRGSPLYKTIETILLACALLCAGPLAAKETILVVNAHPDDSESMAGTLYLLKDRFALHYATLTKGQYRDLQSLGKDGPMAEIRTKEEHAAAKSRGDQTHFPKGARLAECFAPLTGFRLQGKPCIFNELSSPKGGER